jgi:hypothetical protein
VRATSWRQWLGFVAFSVVVVGSGVAVFVWVVATWIIKSCGC